MFRDVATGPQSVPVVRIVLGLSGRPGKRSSKPLTNPTTPIVPPTATAGRDRGNVSAPPASTTRSAQLRVRGGRDDHPGPGGLGGLRGEQAHPTGSRQQDRRP